MSRFSTPRDVMWYTPSGSAQRGIRAIPPTLPRNVAAATRGDKQFQIRHASAVAVPATTGDSPRSALSAVAGDCPRSRSSARKRPLAPQWFFAAVAVPVTAGDCPRSAFAAVVGDCPRSERRRAGAATSAWWLGAVVVQGVEVRAVARLRRPLVRALDRRSLAPLVERRHELERRARRDHVAHVAPPAIEVARQPRLFVDAVEAGRDLERVPVLAQLVHDREVLVPAVRLRRALAEPRKDLQHEKRTDRVRLAPARDRGAALGAAVHEDDEPAAEAQVRGRRAVGVAHVLE